jgi:Fe(3+) dicitrate transport protein
MGIKVSAQTVSISGTVLSFNGQPEPMVTVHLQGVEQSIYTNDKGQYQFLKINQGETEITFFKTGFKTKSLSIRLRKDEQIDVQLKNLSKEYEEVTIKGFGEEKDFTIRRMKTIEGAGIYSSRKTEVVELAKVQGINLANNRARQVFAKVSGLNIWESDCAGIQIGVGSRGLSPNRTENFNMRQNGYDIAADALGYPESYYSPPMQAIQKIEVIRGAASLQFGPQFGGLINFVMKDGVDGKKVQLEANQSFSSNQAFANYLSAGGTLGTFRYFVMGQYKKGQCWRCNSEYDNYTIYATASKIWPHAKLKLDYTRMHYLAKQSGGLTDRQFEIDPSQSNRTRNWFKVDWNVLSLSYTLKKRNTRIDVRNFGVLAERNSLGFIGPPSESDPISNPAADEYTQNRNLLSGQFRNIGHETRVLHTYSLNRLPSSFLAGLRLYRGHTKNTQGAANALPGPEFNFIDSVDANSSNSSHPSWNAAFFAENVFNLSEKWSITPGFRLEYINTKTEGSARTIYRNQAGSIFLDSTRTGISKRQRFFPLFGIGTSYKPTNSLELYLNVSQNYKPINFTDLWVSNPSFRIDPGMKDETGFNADFGIRGRFGKYVRLDATLFALWYSNRIGSVQSVDEETFAVYRLRTNVSNARTFGLESFIEAELIRPLLPESKIGLRVFSNFTILNARYVSSAEPAFSEKEVEFTPSILFRTGTELSYKGIQMNFQFNYTGSQFTDATNSESTPNAINGRIPAYYVMDLTLGYQFQNLNFNIGIENLSDNRYFTRRATGYPGPGILPSENRTFFVSIGLKI